MEIEITLKRIGRKMRNEKGFTLVELLVAMAVGAIVMTSAYSMYVSQQKAYQITEEVTALHQNLRASMFFIERDLRMAGYNPTKAATSFGFTGMTASSVDVTMDSVLENGAIGTGETISYSISGNTLLRNCVIVADNITGVAFTYLDTNGSVTALKSSVRSVDVSLSGSEGVHTRQLTARVRCRNMGL